MKRTMMMLAASISEVFEKMFFLYLEMTEERHNGPFLKASISFSGSESGVLDMYFSESLLTSMAQNMLSLEAGKIGKDEREDCAREAANMVCGNFLAAMEPARRYDMTIPRCIEVDTMQEEDAQADGRRMDYSSGGTNWALAAILSAGFRGS
ncbi:MAG: chemotaxis protein CheX [Syntrophales bacterium]|nr:chemotaxis protein CheX [Syntrophales bacterium]